MKQINQLINIIFLRKSDHAFLRFCRFIIWPCDFEVMATAEFKVILVVIVVIMIAIVAQTESNME